MFVDRRSFARPRPAGSGADARGGVHDNGGSVGHGLCRTRERFVVKGTKRSRNLEDRKHHARFVPRRPLGCLLVRQQPYRRCVGVQVGEELYVGCEMSYSFP